MKPEPSVKKNDSITAVSRDVVSACFEMDFARSAPPILAAIEIAKMFSTGYFTFRPPETSGSRCRLHTTTAHARSQHWQAVGPAL